MMSHNNQAGMLQLWHSRPMRAREPTGHQRVSARVPVTLSTHVELSVARAIIAAMTTKLTRTALSDAVSGLGWRLILNRLDTVIIVNSVTAGAQLVAQLVERCVPADEAAIRFDLRPGAVLVTIEPTGRPLAERDVDLARAISAAVADLGAETVSEPTGPAPVVVQGVEFAVDAMDIDAVRPFWRAVMGYVDAPDGSLYDPGQRGFPVWFQQMDEPRTQRNRVHFDVVVAHDAAEARLAATLAAGGTLVSDAEAPSFWILADVEGNEVCICTWLGRDADRAESDPGVTL
jgi:4a-hydroxytetrahydrobiopterin dehydratase